MDPNNDYHKIGAEIMKNGAPPAILARPTEELANMSSQALDEELGGQTDLGVIEMFDMMSMEQRMEVIDALKAQPDWTLGDMVQEYYDGQEFGNEARGANGAMVPINDPSQAAPKTSPQPGLAPVSSPDGDRMIPKYHTDDDNKPTPREEQTPQQQDAHDAWLDKMVAASGGRVTKEQLKTMLGDGHRPAPKNQDMTDSGVMGRR